MKECTEKQIEQCQEEITKMFLFSQKKKDTYKNSVDDTSKYDNEKIEALHIEVQQLREIVEKNSTHQILKFTIAACTFVFTLFTAFGMMYSFLDKKFDKVNEKIDKCLTEKDIEALQKSVNKIELWAYGDITDQKQPGADRRLEKIEELLSITPINVNDGIASNLLYNFGMEDNHSTIPTSLNPKTYLGKDSSGNKYNIEDIINKKVLLTYNEDDKEIYFFGSLNDQLYWNGDCLTNAYNNDGTLYGVCESKFENGNRKSYESFYLSSVKEEWIYTNRWCTEEGNAGISERYSFTYDKIKNFTNSNVRVSDLLYIKNFNNKDNKVLLSSYHGLTKNGVYNDDTGSAYLIKYFTPEDSPVKNDKQIIKLLYQGKFVDGQPSDTGYDSWSISRESDTTYMFFKGGFSEGKSIRRDKNKEEFENYLTHDQIDKYLQKYGFYNYSEYFVTEYEKQLN